MSTSATKWNLQRLFQEVVCDRPTCTNWCKANGLLPTSQICPEGHIMTLHELEESKRPAALGHFRCKKKHVSAKYFTISWSRNTMFQNAKLPPEKLLLMTYCFTCHDFNQGDSIHESSIFRETICTQTMSEWYFFCRELITDYFLKHSVCNEKLGGKGILIEAEQWKFGKRKFIGDLNSEMWTLAMVETKSRHFHIAICPDNKCDHRTLFEIIEEQVLPGTTIVIKNPKAYQCISKNYNFTDPATDCDPSEEIDDLGSTMPTRSLLRLNAGIHFRKTYGDYALEYMWRHEMKMSNKDVFESFLRVIRSQYPVVNKEVTE